jgi:hypothetical protein
LGTSRGQLHEEYARYRDADRLHIAGGQAPREENPCSKWTADTDMLESGSLDQTDSAQKRTEGATTVSENAGSPKNRTGDLIFSSADIARPDMGIPGGGGGPPPGGTAPGSSAKAKIGAWAGLAAWSAGFLRWLYWVLDRPEPDELKGPNPYEQEPKPAAMPPKSYPPPVVGPPPVTGR